MILYSIGRNPNNKYVISQHEDPRHVVSDYHAEIYIRDDGSICIIDRSTNGTTINGKRIEKEVEVNVNRGDKVVFAGVHQLIWEKVPNIAPPPVGWHLYSIGTAYNNRIQLADTTNTVSRFHATLKIDQKGKMFINDHSTNGTYVNGNRIPANKDFQIKRNDQILFANISALDWTNIPKSKLKPVFIIAPLSALIVIVFIVLSILKGWIPMPDGKFNISDYQSSVVMIYNEFYYLVEFDDDAAGETIKIGNDGTENGNFVAEGFGECHPFISWATGFFVSKDGLIATNRHVAMPWEYFLTNDQNDKLRNYIEVIQNYKLEQNKAQFNYYYKKYNLSEDQILALIAKLKRIGNCRIKKITGVSNRIRVGYFGAYYESLEKFDPCTFINDSKDKEIDVALIQLYSKTLPKDNIKVIDTKKIKNAKDLKVGDILTTIGYPMGPEYLTLRNDDGGLKTVMKTGEISRVPGKIEIDFNIEVLGGASGSPLFDKSGRFVGVVSSHFIDSSTNGKGVLGKYVNKLLDELK